MESQNPQERKTFGVPQRGPGPRKQELWQGRELPRPRKLRSTAAPHSSCFPSLHLAGSWPAMCWFAGPSRPHASLASASRAAPRALSAPGRGRGEGFVPLGSAPEPRVDAELLAATGGGQHAGTSALDPRRAQGEGGSRHLRRPLNTRRASGASACTGWPAPCFGRQWSLRHPPSSRGTRGRLAPPPRSCRSPPKGG